MSLRSGLCLGLLLVGTAIPPMPPVHSPAVPAPLWRVSVPYGSVLAPAGSVSCQTGGSVDTIFGHIQISRPSVRVAYSGGMVEPRPKGTRAPGYRWIKQERIPGGLLLYGERTLKGHRIVEANVGRVSFVMLVNSDPDIQFLLSMARTYLPGPCPSCSSTVAILDG